VEKTDEKTLRKWKITKAMTNAERQAKWREKQRAKTKVIKILGWKIEVKITRSPPE
jgi:hypothetical protein